MESEETMEKKLAQKSRVRKQRKRKVSKTSGTLSQQARRSLTARKRAKKDVKINLKIT